MNKISKNSAIDNTRSKEEVKIKLSYFLNKHDNLEENQYNMLCRSIINYIKSIDFNYEDNK